MLLFGETFEDIIAWQDLYVQTEGPTHRKYRHDPDAAPTEAAKHFITETNTYPESKKEMIMNAVKSHIACDLISSSVDHSIPSMIRRKQVTEVSMVRCKRCGHKTLTINMLRKHYQKHHPSERILF